MNAYLVIGVVIAGVLALAGIGVLCEVIASRRDRRRFPAPGRLVDVGGHRLHVTVAGEQSATPTVVLEAGMASMSSNWAWVRDELSRDRRVVAYDRAGLGWSDRGSGSMDLRERRQRPGTDHIGPRALTRFVDGSHLELRGVPSTTDGVCGVAFRAGRRLDLRWVRSRDFGQTPVSEHQEDAGCAHDVAKAR